MKAISSSIIVLAGAVMLAGGSLADDRDTRAFVHGAGTLVGLIGMAAWASTLKSS